MSKRVSLNGSELKSDMIVTSGAGNLVYKLLQHSVEQPEWVRNTNGVQWDALLLFDASCVQTTPSIVKMTSSGTNVLFDKSRFELFLQQVELLKNVVGE